MKRNKCLSAIVLLLMILFRFDITYAETVKYTSCGTTKDIPYYLPSLIRTFIIIIQFVIPIIIIIIGSTDFLKVIFGNNKDDLSKAIKKFALRLIAGAGVFLLVTLVKELITITNDENNSNSLSECFSCFVVDDSYCTSYDVEVDKDSDKNENLSNIEKQKQFLEKREQQRKENEEKANSAKKRNTTGSKNSGNAVTNPGTKNIFIGDSRTVQMCAHLTGNWTKCQYDLIKDAYYNNNDIYIAQGNMGYIWLVDEAIPEVNKILDSHPNERYNIISNLGVNGLTYINSYISKYKELANGRWKNHNLIIVSVNPVKGSYSHMTNDIISFNNNLKSGLSDVANISYCDTYSKIVNNFSSGDGLHYLPNTSKDIYNAILSCIGN